MTDALKFAPEIRVYEHDQGNSWAVSFDTRSPIDTGRGPRIVFIEKTPAIKHLAISVEGFDVAPRPGAEEDGQPFFMGTFSGTISLSVVRKDSDSPETHVLAKCRLKVLGKRQGKASTEDERNRGRSTKYNFPDVESVVRNACANALSGVIADFFDTAATRGGVEYPEANQREAVAVTRPALAPQRERTARLSGRQFTQAETRWHRYRPWAAVAAAALVVWVALATISHRGQSSSQEVGAAVAAQLQQDPNAAMAQVELTKQTLASMGLDPGASGDTGCLVSPAAQATAH